MGRAMTPKVNAGRARGSGGNGRAAVVREGTALRVQEGHPAEEVRELFQAEVGAAKKRLVELLQSNTEKIALDAANAILDRVFGKPRQVAEPPEGKRALLPIAFYEVDCVDRADADGPERGVSE